MEQPSSPSAPSYPLNRTLRPRVAQRTYSLVHLEDEEATCMPARIAAAFTLKKRPGLPLFCACLLALLFISAASSMGQTAAHSPGWVVLPVDEYRDLHARAYPIERDPEPPPVEATLTRVDYDLRIEGELDAQVVINTRERGFNRRRLRIAFDGIGPRVKVPVFIDRQDDPARRVSGGLSHGAGRRNE